MWPLHTKVQRHPKIKLVTFITINIAKLGASQIVYTLLKQSHFTKMLYAHKSAKMTKIPRNVQNKQQLRQKKIFSFSLFTLFLNFFRMRWMQQQLERTLWMCGYAKCMASNLRNRERERAQTLFQISLVLVGIYFVHFSEFWWFWPICVHISTCILLNIIFVNYSYNIASETLFFIKFLWIYDQLKKELVI